MAHCYRCGCLIEGSRAYKRRRVKTGEWTRRRYPKQTIAAATTHYGWRIVCNRCARQIDLAYAKREFTEWMKLGIALIILFALLLATIQT